MAYDYVTKSEVYPYKQNFNNWIDNIRSNIKNEGISFTFQLVGSAKRNLVIRHHNKGFDCDYQIKITKNKNNLDPKKIKQLFIDEFNKLVEDSNYKSCEDSTSAITIKELGNKSNIVFSYDIVLIKEENENVCILMHNKHNNNNYVFEQLPDMKDHVENFKKIKGPEMWKQLRQIYYDKKINNKEEKKSFQILNKSVNEVLQKY